MRLGERLIEDGVIDGDQLDLARAQQIVLGGRIGTNLVELGALNLDTLADGLARHHDMPAALQRHFDRSDAQVQALVPPALAVALSAVALGRLDEAHVAVAFMDPPAPEAIIRLRTALGCEPVPAIAPELRVRYHLERSYGHPRPNRFLRVVPRRADAMASDRRRYVTSLADAEPVGRIALARLAVSVPRPADSLEGALSLTDALKAIRSATGRDRVADRAVATLSAGFAGQIGAALLCAVRDEMAFGWSGFGPSPRGDFLEAIAVPLCEPSSLREGYHLGPPYAGPPITAGRDLDARMWEALGSEPPRSVVVAPLELRGRVVALLYAHASDGGPVSDLSVAAVEQVARASATAFERLMAAAQR